MMNPKKSFLAASVTAMFCLAVVNVSYADQEHGYKYGHDKKLPELTGNCASLPADRITEFHGNPATSELNLAMAGNQWVVFNKVMQAFNERRVAMGEGDVDTSSLVNKTRTLAELKSKGNRYFIELIPPGLERNQIKSGCMILGNEDERNFLPFSIQTRFDVFTSTNYNLMRDLASSGFVTEAVPYIRNQLTLMTDADNSSGIGGAAGDDIIDATLDLLDADIRVSQVDHINEGIHRGINNMYKRMDEYLRLNGTTADIAALDSSLAAVSVPQPGSPAETRTLQEGISTNFDLSTNPECFYSGHASIADGTLRMCEYAILNKTNTHETRVHHVETPARILAGESDVGPLWVSELQLAVSNGDAVSGSQMPDSVNLPVVYSVAFLETMSRKHKDLARDFVEFLRTDATAIYVAGGFSALTGSEQGERYSFDTNGNLLIEQFTP